MITFTENLTFGRESDIMNFTFPGKHSVVRWSVFTVPRLSPVAGCRPAVQRATPSGYQHWPNLPSLPGPAPVARGSEAGQGWWQALTAHLRTCASDRTRLGVTRDLGGHGGAEAGPTPEAPGRRAEGAASARPSLCWLRHSWAPGSSRLRPEPGQWAWGDDGGRGFGGACA